MRETWEAVAYQTKHMLTKLRKDVVAALFAREVGVQKWRARASVAQRTAISGYAGQKIRKVQKKSFFNCGGEELSRTYKSISNFPVGGKLWC